MIAPVRIDCPHIRTRIQRTQLWQLGKRPKVRIKSLFICGAVVTFSGICTPAQQPERGRLEQSVPLTASATAFDSTGAAGLEGTLRTTTLNGAPDSPVTNIRVVIKNRRRHFLQLRFGSRYLLR